MSFQIQIKLQVQDPVFVFGMLLFDVIQGSLIELFVGPPEDRIR